MTKPLRRSFKKLAGKGLFWVLSDEQYRLAL
jgi:hypothetical protein